MKVLEVVRFVRGEKATDYGKLTGSGAGLPDMDFDHLMHSDTETKFWTGSILSDLEDSAVAGVSASMEALEKARDYYGRMCYTVSARIVEVPHL